MAAIALLAASRICVLPALAANAATGFLTLHRAVFAATHSVTMSTSRRLPLPPLCIFWSLPAVLVDPPLGAQCSFVTVLAVPAGS